MAKWRRALAALIIGGISAYVKSLWPNIEIIGVEPTDSAAMTKSLEAGKIIELPTVGLNASEISDGEHVLTINADDRAGYQTTKSFTFIIDNEPPVLEIRSPKNNTSVSNTLVIDLQLTDENLPEKDKISLLLPTGVRITDETVYSFNTTGIENGQYQINIFATDKASNSLSEDIMFTVDHSIVDKPKPKVSEQIELDPILILIIVGIAIAITSAIVFSQKNRKIVSNH